VDKPVTSISDSYIKILMEKLNRTEVSRIRASLNLGWNVNGRRVSDCVRVQAVCRRPHRGGLGIDLRPVREGFVVDELLLRQVYVRSSVFTYQLSLCQCSIFLLLRPPMTTVSLNKPQTEKTANS